MIITRESVAGTLESSDVMVYVAPHEGGIVLEINSSVGQQFQAQIEASVLAVLKEQNVQNVALRLEDKGAPDAFGSRQRDSRTDVIVGSFDCYIHNRPQNYTILRNDIEG